MARSPLALAAGVIGAPLSYLAASKLGAVNLPMGMLRSGLILAAAWLPLMAVFIVITRAVENRTRDRLDRAAPIQNAD